MKRKIKVKANAMEEADVSFVSLVTRPASRIPFRVLKSDDDPEEGSMFNLSNLFKQDGEAAAPKGCTLAGVVLQKQHVEHFTPQLKELGLKTDDIVEDGDCVIMKQCDFKESDATLIKLNEMGGLFLNAPDSVKKGFEPWPEGNDFAQNIAGAGFLPGVNVATEVMIETMRNVLRTAEGPEAAREGVDTLMTSFKSHVVSLMDDLPSVAFKIDALDLTGYEVVDLTGDPEANAAAAEEQEAESAKKDDAADTAEAKKDDGLTDEERKALKGVHIEDLDVKKDDGDEDEIVASMHCPECKEEVGLTESEAEEVHRDKAEGMMTCPKCKAKFKAPMKKGDEEEEEKSEPSLADLLAGFKTEVLEAVAGVRSEVTDLRSKQEELATKVDDAAEVAEKAHKAVKGTVPSNSDAGDRISDQSLGTHRSKAAKADEGMWGGTALDRIAGDVSQ